MIQARNSFKMAPAQFQALILGPIWKAENRKVCQVWQATGESQHERAQQQTHNLYLTDTYRAVPTCDSTITILHLAHTKVVVKWVRNSREGAFPEEAAGCLRATGLQDYRGAKMNVTKTTNVHRVAEKGWYHSNSLRARGTACGAEVDYPPEREHGYMSLRLTWPHF